MKAIGQVTAEVIELTESIRIKLSDLDDSPARDATKNAAIEQLIVLADIAEDAATAILFNQ